MKANINCWKDHLYASQFDFITRNDNIAFEQKSN